MKKRKEKCERKTEESCLKERRLCVNKQLSRVPISYVIITFGSLGVHYFSLKDIVFSFYGVIIETNYGPI